MSHVAPTQVVFPWKATARTVVQSVAGVLLGAVSIIGTVNIFAPQVLVAVVDVLPAEWAVWATGAVAFIGVLSGAVARVMAIPGVNEWLKKVALGASV